MSVGIQTCYCSFCGKSNREAVVLIAGPTVFICDECVLATLPIIREHYLKRSLKNVCLDAPPISPALEIAPAPPVQP